jgi:hypothetical protein
MTLRIILLAYAISAALALLSLWAIPAPAQGRLLGGHNAPSANLLA